MSPQVERQGNISRDVPPVAASLTPGFSLRDAFRALGKPVSPEDNDPITLTQQESLGKVQEESAVEKGLGGDGKGNSMESTSESDIASPFPGMTRRGFLKGVLGTIGVAVVGKSFLAPSDAQAAQINSPTESPVSPEQQVPTRYTVVKRGGEKSNILSVKPIEGPEQNRELVGRLVMNIVPNQDGTQSIEIHIEPLIQQPVDTIYSLKSSEDGARIVVTGKDSQGKNVVAYSEDNGVTFSKGNSEKPVYKTQMVEGDSDNTVFIMDSDGIVSIYNPNTRQFSIPGGTAIGDLQTAFRYEGDQKVMYKGRGVDEQIVRISLDRNNTNVTSTFIATPGVFSGVVTDHINKVGQRHVNQFGRTSKGNDVDIVTRPISDFNISVDHFVGSLFADEIQGGNYAVTSFSLPVVDASTNLMYYSLQLVTQSGIYQRIAVFDLDGKPNQFLGNQTGLKIIPSEISSTDVVSSMSILESAGRKALVLDIDGKSSRFLDVSVLSQQEPSTIINYGGNPISNATYIPTTEMFAVTTK